MYVDVGACLTMIAVALALCVFAQPAVAVHTSIVPSFQSVSSGEDFTVDIYVDPEGSAIGGVDYILCFNNALLNGTLLTKGTFFDSYDTMEYGDGINNTLGEVDYGECIWPIAGEGVTTPGTLTTITFQAIAEYGIDELYIKTVTVSDPDGYKISNVTVGNGTVRIGTCGDVNNDNRVTMGDGRRIYMNQLYGPEEYPIASSWAADVNSDTRITMGDGRRIYMNQLYGSEEYPLNCC